MSGDGEGGGCADLVVECDATCLADREREEAWREGTSAVLGRSFPGRHAIDWSASAAEGHVSTVGSRQAHMVVGGPGTPVRALIPTADPFLLLTDAQATGGGVAYATGLLDAAWALAVGRTAPWAGGHSVGNLALPRLALSPFPSPALSGPGASASLAHSLALALFAGIALPLVMDAAITSVAERECGGVGHLQSMGLLSSAYLAAQAFVAVLFGAYAVSIMLVVLVSAHVLVHSSLLLLALLCLGLSLSSLAHGVIVGSLFNKSLLASRAASLSLIASGALFTLADETILGANDRLSATSVLASAIMPSFAFCKGASALFQLELAGLGATWSPGAINDAAADWPIAPGALALPDARWPLIALASLTLQCIWLAAAAVALTPSAVYASGTTRPGLVQSMKMLIGRFGRGLPLGSSVGSDDGDRLLDSVAGVADSRDVGDDDDEDEDDASGDGVASSDVRLVRLRKVYPSTGAGVEPVVAVDEVSLRLRSGQMTALIGPNGAGKTTTLGMLAGLVAPTSGDVRVCGISGAASPWEVRRRLGVCPQRNCLFPLLTAREHLYLYGAIRGMLPAEVDTEGTRLLKALGVRARDADLLSGALSGGTKRKVHVAGALIGKSAVVLLDEPMSGLDPASRRLLRRTLRRETRNRVSVVTTHAMEDAESLADRIVLLARGRVRADGSALSLRSSLASGLEVRVVVRPEHRAQVQEVLLARGCSLDSEDGNELRFGVPDADSLDDGLTELQSLKEEGHVELYAVASPSLEQAFVRIAAGV